MTKPKRTAHVRRYREIAQILGRHGLEWLLLECGLGALTGEEGRLLGRPVERQTQPEHVRLALEELGTTFIKFGQVLSTRPGLAPPEYAAELSRLQDSAPPVPYREIAAVIERELGGRPGELFASFETEPRASASIGQVHGARLRDGAPVVVKVQRPGVEAQVEEDLAILGEIAHRVARHTRLGARYDVEGWVEEFALTLRGELDYLREGENADRIRRNCAGDATLCVPRIFWEHTTPRVLVMEEIRGIKVGDLAALEAAGVDRHGVAETCARIALTQILEHGFFHADPHPGNFFVMPDGVIGLVDFGMVGRLDNRLRESLMRLGLAVIRKDAERLVDELIELGIASGPIRRPALERDLDRLIRRYSDRPVGETCTASVAREVAAIASRHRLQFPSDFTLLVRVVAMCEGMGARLAPGFRLKDVAQPYLQRFWWRACSPEALARHFLGWTADVAEMAPLLPKRLWRLLNRLEHGELTVTSRIDGVEEMRRSFLRAADRVTVSILASGLMIGLSVLAAAYHTSGDAGSGALFLKAALGLGAVMGLGLLAGIWRTRR
jgi:ubiquinone biosynthesis protein